MKVLVFLVALSLFSSIAVATDLTGAQAEMAKTIFSNTMSPYCPGRLLEDCPSASASELKEKIRQRLASGESQESIEQYLFSVYGDSVRAAPGWSGFGLAAWIAPAIFLVVGLVFIMIWLKRNTAKAEKDSAYREIESSWEDKIDREIR